MELLIEELLGEIFEGLIEYEVETLSGICMDFRLICERRKLLFLVSAKFN